LLPSFAPEQMERGRQQVAAGGREGEEDG